MKRLSLKKQFQTNKIIIFGKKLESHLNAEIPSVHVVPKEYVVAVGKWAADLKQLDQVVKLPVHIAANLKIIHIIYLLINDQKFRVNKTKIVLHNVHGKCIFELEFRALINKPGINCWSSGLSI